MDCPIALSVAIQLAGLAVNFSDLVNRIIDLNKKTLTAEAITNSLPIPQITYFWMWRNWKVIYYAKSEVLDLELNLLFSGI